MGYRATILVKAAKAKANRKTGAATSELTVTIQPAVGTKVSLKGDLDVDSGAISIRAKDGSFSGSFKAYVNNVRGKPKAVSVSVSGVVVDGVGYGSATVKNLGSIPVTIK